MKKIFMLALLCATLSGVVQAESALETMSKVDRVVARVGDVWIKDAKYDAFHKEISAKFPDTPALEQFKNDETWVVVRSAASVRFTGIYKVRSPALMSLKNGDIVEAKIMDSKQAKLYKELSEVTRVVCKSGDANYEECEKANPLSWFDKNGEKLLQPR